MKRINHLNYFFVGVPSIAFIISFLDNQNTFLIFGLLFSILTGLFQVTIGGCMLIDEPKDKKLQVYIYGVIFYFAAPFIISPLIKNEILQKSITFGIPTLLAFYLSILIYKKAHQ